MFQIKYIFFLFADDTSVFIECDDIESTIKILNSELKIAFHDFPSC